MRSARACDASRSRASSARRTVPQMADAEAVLQALAAAWPAIYIGLVLNRKGFERAVAAGCNEIGMAVMASDTFNRRNQGASTAESIAAWLDIASAAQGCRHPVEGHHFTAFGCPFEGEVPMARVVETCAAGGCGRSSRNRTGRQIGVGVPAQVRDLVGPCERSPARCSPPLPLPQYPEYRACECLRRAAIGGRGPRCQHGRDRRLSVRPGRDRQYSDRGPGLHAAPLRLPDRHFAGAQRSRPAGGCSRRSAIRCPGMLVKAGGFPRPSAPVA